MDAEKTSPETDGNAPGVSDDLGLTTYKGFDKNLQCRDFQFEIGKTYEVDGEIKACKNGFHACEHPLNVFSYYPPNSSRFAVVKQSGAISRHKDDTKIASAKITIEAEIQLPELIAAAVKWVFDRAKWVGAPVATGDNEAATASGTGGAATASGTGGAARGTDGSALSSFFETTTIRSRTCGLALLVATASGR